MKSVKIFRPLATSVAVVALIAVGVGGATASAREPELTPVNTATMSLNNQPVDDPEWMKYARQNDIPFYTKVGDIPLYPEINLASMRQLTVGDYIAVGPTVACASATATTVSPGGSFTFNGQLVSTKIARNGIGITTSANKEFAIIVRTSEGPQATRLPASPRRARHFLLQNRDWFEGLKVPPAITFCG